MKKILFVAIALLCTIGTKIQAQEKGLGYFNCMSIGANIGTTGWGIDVATPIGNHFALRAGFTIMPDFSYTDDVDVSISSFSSYYSEIPEAIPTSMEVEASIGRTSGEVLLNIYPFKRSSFFLTGGAVFGGEKFMKLQGHSDELKNFRDIGIEIGDYIIPVDKNGNVSGGIKVANFRPYVGLGFGRIVPKNKRVGFLFELGFQFHKTPIVYTEEGNLGHLLEESDNDFTDIIDNLTAYPVMRFRLCGKLF